MKSFSIILIVFFSTFGIMNFLYGMKPWTNGNIQEYFYFDLLGIISIGFAALIYIIEKNAP